MLPYVIYFLSLIGFSSIEILIKYKDRIYLLIFSFFIYQFFFGFRGFVGWDVINYYAQYVYSQHDTFEWGYTLLVKLFNFLNLDFFVFILFISICQGWMLFSFLRKYSPYPVLSLFICISLTSMNLQIEALRHSFLLLIFLNSLKYIQQKRIMPFSLSMAIGFLFHKLALLLYLMYFVYNFFFDKNKDNKQKLKRKVYLYVVLFLGFMVFSLNLSLIHMFLDVLDFIPLISDLSGIRKLNYYISVKYFAGEGGILSLKFLFFLLLSIPIFFFYRKITNISQEAVFFYEFFLISWIVYFYTSGVMVVWFRVYLLTFTFPMWILIPILIHSFKDKFKWFLFIFYSVFCIFRLSHTLNSYPYLEYKNILLQDDNYENRKNFIEIFDDERGLLERY